MKKLAASSGTVIYEAENRLYLCKESGTATGTILFVTGLLGFILLGNGVLQLTVFKDQVPGSSKLGIILIGIGIIFAIVFWRLKLYQKKQSTTPPEQLQTICIFDFNNNNLLNSQQNILCPITEAWLTRKMQLTSSSPELIVQWKGGTISIAKGNPFSGGIGEIEKLLVAKGVRRK